MIEDLQEIAVPVFNTKASSYEIIDKYKIRKYHVVIDWHFSIGKPINLTTMHNYLIDALVLNANINSNFLIRALNSKHKDVRMIVSNLMFEMTQKVRQEDKVSILEQLYTLLYLENDV